MGCAGISPLKRKPKYSTLCPRPLRTGVSACWASLDLGQASFEWRSQQEGTLQQVRVSLQSALKFVLIDSADPMMLQVFTVERTLFSL